MLLDAILVLSYVTIVLLGPKEGKLAGEKYVLIELNEGNKGAESEGTDVVEISRSKFNF